MALLFAITSVFGFSNQNDIVGISALFLTLFSLAIYLTFMGASLVMSLKKAFIERG
ncbi:hypothetical protein KGQ74_02660 [Patescibacteria group bacterium]|nr:hypothetical protein [Patescibacteria group bacterium]